LLTGKVVSLRSELQQEEFLSRNMNSSKWSPYQLLC